MLTKKTIRRLYSVLWVIVLMLSSAQPVYAAPVESVKAATEPAMLKVTSGAYVLGFKPGGMLAATVSHALNVGFMNANPVQPQSDVPGSRKSQISPLDQVTYTNLWDGIDLDYTAKDGSIYTTTYHLAPGANPSSIRLLYNTPPVINKDGSLGISYLTGTLNESAPIAWQQINSQRVPVAVSFRVEGQQVGFILGVYDPAYALTIDPSLVWNTFLGGSDDDYIDGITMDGSGNLYVTGSSYAAWGSPVRAFTNNDAFVAKLNPSGVLVWSTFLGGSDNDYGSGIALDGSGNIYVTGLSYDTWGSPLRPFTVSGHTDAFVARLNSGGALVWNTFLGGSADDRTYGIDLDSSGKVYVSGTSGSTWGNPVRIFSDGRDAFAARLSSSGTLEWNTFLGSYNHEDGYGIAVDGSGNVFVAGDSNANWGTPIHAYTYGYYDAFIARLNSNGTLVWNTFLGSNDNDEAHAIAVDGSDNVFVTGVSNISWGTPLRSFTSSDCDAFVARLNSSGTFVWNTFLGGGDNDEGHGIATDSSGNVFVTGFSYAAWGTPVRAYTGYKDAFAARLNPSGVLQSNAFLGGDEHDYGQSIVVDSGGNSYIAGGSGSTWGSPVRTFSNYEDAFIAKVNLPVPPPAAATLVYPLVTSPTHTPTYIWSKVTGATLYRLWVKNSLGTWIIQSLYNGTNICGVTNCAVTPGTSLDNGVYTWYIQTLTATQNGSWATHSFTVSAPGKVTMVAPKGTIHIAKPTFIWSKDTVATLYRLWVKNSSGTWVIQKLYAGKNICGATNCAIVSPNSFTNGAYTWYIQTLTATQNGQWSGQSITISVPDVVPSLSGSETGVMK